ncbi:hypothetical protein BCR32DRAFT_265022 [Anaeromyces robustus]|uniref:Uncharacterized protein n=1 Tax=Anaeromyces robustus TaxID=1754192 RepID=A0A1Y1XKU6_9FUNG|nr:hypothetical protein BCR32DRAFT_265022 [Anaeromyces robustus]|eukprot:ORX86335.1 hypothetical protein BCR32DRAFT_265022 [Anaeromyces robustus]
MPKQTGSKSYTDIELCLIFKEILYQLPYKKSEWEKIYEPCKIAVETYNKTHKDQLIIRKAKAIARKFEDMTYSSKKIASNEVDSDNFLNNNTHTQLCHIATQIKALCKINFLFKEGQKNYKLNKIIIKRRRRILQSISQVEKYYYEKKYNEDIDNSLNNSDTESKPSVNSFSEKDNSSIFIDNSPKDKFNQNEFNEEKRNLNNYINNSENDNKNDNNDILQKKKDIKYIKSVMKNIKDHIYEVNENDDYNKIIEQSLTSMRTLNKILNDAIIFCNMIANKSKSYQEDIDDEYIDFSDDISIFSDNEDTYVNSSKDTIDKSLNTALRIINEDESKSSETIYEKDYSNDSNDNTLDSFKGETLDNENIENDFSLSNLIGNKKSSKKRKINKESNSKKIKTTIINK